MAPMQSWMNKVQPSLDKSEPVHGDIGTVDTLMDSHAVRQIKLVLGTVSSLFPH